MEQVFAEVWRSLPIDLPIGVGTGSTIEAWLSYGRDHGYIIRTAVASSQRTAKMLKALGTEVTDLQSESTLAAYVDSADEINESGVCIKGGGGAMTLEKIVCSAARDFICIIDKKKLKSRLGDFPVALEVLPSVRSYVGRNILSMGADPVYREGFITDSGNIILDVYGLDFSNLASLESELNQLLGVVGHGLFYTYSADKIYFSEQNFVKVIKNDKCF